MALLGVGDSYKKLCNMIDYYLHKTYNHLRKEKNYLVVKKLQY